MWLFVCRSGPANDMAVRELVDMAMVAAVFGQPCRLLLLGDGVLNLGRRQASPLQELADLLPEPFLVEEKILARGLIGSNCAPLTVTTATPGDIARLFHDSDRVVMF